MNIFVRPTSPHTKSRLIISNNAKGLTDGQAFILFLVFSLLKSLKQHNGCGNYYKTLGCDAHIILDDDVENRITNGTKQERQFYCPLVVREAEDRQGILQVTHNRKNSHKSAVIKGDTENKCQAGEYPLNGFVVNIPDSYDITQDADNILHSSAVAAQHDRAGKIDHLAQVLGAQNTFHIFPGGAESICAHSQQGAEITNDDVHYQFPLEITAGIIAQLPLKGNGHPIGIMLS